MRWTLALLLVTAALAGCIGGSDGDATTTEAGPEDQPGTTGSQQEGLQADGTTAEANATDEEAMAWLETYWDGAREKTLVDESQELFPTVFAGPLRIGDWAALFTPDVVVAPGTTSINLTASWETPQGASGDTAILYYGTPSLARSESEDAEPGSVEITSGETVTVQVDEADREVPFQPRSHWWFEVSLQGEPAGAYASNQVQLTATAHRQAELPNLTVAPDPWEGADRMTLVDNATGTYDVGLQHPAFGWFLLCITQGCQTGWTPEVGALVPPGTETVVVRTTWDWQHPTKPVIDWYVNEEQNGVMTVAEDGEDSRVFELQVPEGATDAARQALSVWFFGVDWETNGQEATGLQAGTFTFSAEAVKGQAR